MSIKLCPLTVSLIVFDVVAPGDDVTVTVVTPVPPGAVTVVVLVTVLVLFTVFVSELLQAL
jgi:hypothetical protein